MSVAIEINMSEDSHRAIAAWQGKPAAARKAIEGALRETLVLVENHLKTELMRGGSVGTPRGGSLPLAERSGSLVGSVTHELTSPTSGFVGTLKGPAESYAHVILGEGETTIRPVKASKLWIPIVDNLNPSGIMKTTPREAMDKMLPSGKRALSIFTSAAGNMVAFLREGGVFKRGKKKGQAKGKLLFVLKDEVTIKGSGALAKAFNDKQSEMETTLNAALAEALTGDGATGGTA